MAEDKLLQWRSLEFQDVSRENGGHVSNTHCLTVNDHTRVKEGGPTFYGAAMAPWALPTAGSEALAIAR